MLVAIGDRRSAACCLPFGRRCTALTLKHAMCHANTQNLKTRRFHRSQAEARCTLPDRMLGPQRSGSQMKLLDALVEQRIAAAVARGEFDDLPGAGAPLALDDDALVPEEVRVANRILKNAGFAPPAVEQLRALRNLKAELS